MKVLLFHLFFKGKAQSCLEKHPVWCCSALKPVDFMLSKGLMLIRMVNRTIRGRFEIPCLA